jgi:cytochrome oxidase Cu insertion factor (SCO1/SenC/PrrC family)
MKSYLYSYLILFSLISVLGCTNKKSTPEKLEDFGTVGDFSFLERNGEQISQDDLKGKVWVASFVFTRCTGPCPQVCATLARLQEKLKNIPDLRIVTFTVDPERDNPKELNLYAENFQSRPKFLCRLQ